MYLTEEYEQVKAFFESLDRLEQKHIELKPEEEEVLADKYANGNRDSCGMYL